MKISAGELQAGAMNEENLKIAVRTLRECGFVVLEDIVARDWVDGPAGYATKLWNAMCGP